MAKNDKPDHNPETGEVIEENTAVTVIDQSGGAVATMDEFDYGEDAGAGFDNQTSEDVSIPFIVVLQPGSPLVQAPDSNYKAGMIINNTTGEILGDTKTGVSFVPALTEHFLVEWVPRDNGGGFVGQHAIDSDLAIQVRRDQALGVYKHPENGNDLIETFYVYGVVLDNETGAAIPAVWPFWSTHIKPYKDWMFRARSIVIPLPDGRKMTSKNLPLWAFGYNVKTKFKSEKGFNWYIPIMGWADKDAMASRIKPGSDVYMSAKSVYEGITSGKTKVDTGNLSRESASDATPAKGDVTAEEAPY